MFDAIVFPDDTNITEKFSNEQIVSSASLKCGMDSDHVLHSITKTH